MQMRNMTLTIVCKMRVFTKTLMRFFLIITTLLLLFGCSMARPVLDYSPGATVDTLSAAVSMSVTTTDHGMSGNGFLVYRRPDQLHLVLLSPFGTTMIEIFSHGEQITLLYPGSSTAYVGRIADLPEKGGLQGWRLMRWVMDADPSNSIGLNGTFERAGSQGVMEKVTFENGLVTAKSTVNGEQVYYSRYTVAGGVPFATELELRNSQDDRIRLVLDEPEVNTPLEDAVFQPRLEGMKILPFSELRGL